MNSLTVLHVSQPVDGGVARVVVDLVRAQVAAGCRVVVACPDEGFLGADARNAGAAVVNWPAVRGPLRGLGRETWALRGIVRQVGPDVLHLHSSKAGLAGRLAVRGGLPTVFQPHAWSFEATAGPLTRAVTAWERWGARWAHRVLCVSEEERDRGEQRGIRAPYTVVRNGVDVSRFDPAVLPAPREARRMLGVPGNARLVVCVGRLCRQKGQDLLLRAWPQVRSALPDAELALVGDGPDREELERRAEGLAGVRFAGPVADPRDWYAAADLVVQPSRWEGMALAPLEAMACARPVLLTDVPGARECLGESELPLAVGDIVELSSGISRMLADLDRCRRLGAQARGRIAERHRLGDTCLAVARVYVELRQQLPFQRGRTPESLTNSSSV